MPLARLRSHKGRKPSLFRHVQQLWFSTIRVGHQNGFLSSGREAKETAGLDGLRFSSSSCKLRSLGRLLCLISYAKRSALEVDCACERFKTCEAGTLPAGRQNGMTAMMERRVSKRMLLLCIYSMHENEQRAQCCIISSCLRDYPLHLHWPDSLGQPRTKNGEKVRLQIKINVDALHALQKVLVFRSPSPWLKKSTL